MQAPLKDKNDIKIFILYLLGSVGYPLDFNTISDIVVQDDFVGYFDFAECFAELVDCGNIEIIHAEPNDLYRITPNGRLVAEQLQSNILGMIREKSLRSAMRVLSFKSRGSDVKCRGEAREDGRYDLKCEIIEKGGPVMELKVVVDSKYQLDRMMTNFDRKPEVVYRGIVSLLTGDINYLLD